MIIGSIFSYLLIIGYYINLESNIPENPTLSITETTFNIENVQTFNVTVLNPTYSIGDATITEISIAGEDDTVHTVTDTEPELPTEIRKGKEQTFTCTLNWGNFTGQTVKVIILVEDGSGSTYTIETDSAEISIAPTFSIFDMEHFNISLANPTATSTIDLDVTQITITTEDAETFNLDIINDTYPQYFIRGRQDDFQFEWNWSNLLNTEVTISVLTAQNITFYHTETLPPPSSFTLTNIIFDPADTARFNITVELTDTNLTIATIESIGIMFKDQTNERINELSPTLPYEISANETITFELLWNWEDYRGETLAIIVEPSEPVLGYIVYTLP